MDGIRQRYNPVEDRWIFECPTVLTGPMLKFAIENARKIQKDRLHGRMPGAMTDAIKASIVALNKGKVVQGILGVKDYSVFKSTTREKPTRSFFIPREA